MRVQSNFNFSTFNRNENNRQYFINTQRRFCTNKDQAPQENKKEESEENKTVKRPWLTWKKVAGFLASVALYEVCKDPIYQFLDLPTESSSQVEELISLGHTSLGSHNHDEALKKFQEAYDMQKKLSGDKNDPQLRAILAFIGYTYLAMENYTEAIRYLEQSNEMNKKLNPEQDQSEDSLSSTLSLIGHTLLSRKNYNEALKYYDQAYQKSKKNDDNHAFVCESMGMCYEELENYKEAVKYYKEAYEIKKGLSVTNLHPEIENSAVFVIRTLRKAGEKKEAEKYQKEVDQIVKKFSK